MDDIQYATLDDLKIAENVLIERIAHGEDNFMTWWMLRWIQEDIIAAEENMYG